MQEIQSGLNMFWTNHLQKKIFKSTKNETKILYKQEKNNNKLNSFK